MLINPWLQIALCVLLIGVCIGIAAITAEGKNKRSSIAKMSVAIAAALLFAGGAIYPIIILCKKDSVNSNHSHLQMRQAYLRAQARAQREYGSLAINLQELAMVDPALAKQLRHCDADSYDSAKLQPNRFNHTVTLAEDCFADGDEETDTVARPLR